MDGLDGTQAVKRPNLSLLCGINEMAWKGIK